MKILPNKHFVIACCAVSLSFFGHSLMAQSSSKNTKLHQVFEAYYEENLKIYPVSATFSGDYKYNDLLPADDAAHLKEIHNFGLKYLSKLKNFDYKSLGKEDRVSYLILKNELESKLRLEKFHLEYIPVNQMDGIPLSFAMLGSGSSAQPFKTVEDYENWLKRCKAFVYWTDTAIENIRKGIKSGMVLPKSTALKMIPQLENISTTDPSTSVFYGPIKNFPESFTQSEKERFTKAYQIAIEEQIIPSYKQLLSFINKEYLPNTRVTSGINALPNGDSLYNELIFQATSSHKTPEQVYQTGLSEVERISKEMEKIKETIGFKGSLQELFVAMKEDKRFMPFTTKDEVIKYYNSIYETIKPQLSTYFGILPKTSFEIRETESFRAASASPQYFAGDLGSNRPGIFYIPILDPTKINITGYESESLFLHEAIPGHHFQFSMQYENHDLPKFRQKYENGTYIEGWGLYTESLGKQLGLLTDPYHQLGALSMEIHRAIRLVVDTAIHTGKMNREEAIKYMLKHESITEKNAISETERYMVWPTQALFYKTGELKIKELRNKYQQQLGSKFSIKEFHDTILLGGSMPLDVLEQYMDEWANSQKI